MQVRKDTAKKTIRQRVIYIYSILLLIWLSAFSLLYGMRFRTETIILSSRRVVHKRRRGQNPIVATRQCYVPTQPFLQPYSKTSVAATNANEKEWQCLPFVMQQPRLVSNILVCGDGDFSYSALIAPTLHQLGIKMTSTVLETKEVHTRIYSLSDFNKNVVESFGHTVQFGIDATNLQAYDLIKRYDRVQFNFPHTPGKSNIRRNRLLLQAFLSSSSKLISEPHGEIHVALFANQGGLQHQNLSQWKSSWLSAQYGAECGLLLASVTPFISPYKRSSYRGQDKSFHYDTSNNPPELYKFIRGPCCLPIPQHLQLCFRHELHVLIPLDEYNSNNSTTFVVEQGESLRSEIQDTLPDGVVVDVPRTWIIPQHSTLSDKDEQFVCCCFLVVYRGERRAVTRCEADSFRDRAEQVAKKSFRLRENRIGKSVSRPFPYCTLQSIMNEKDQP